MAELVRCSVAVEVKGKPLHPDKSSKEHGLRMEEPGKSIGGRLPAVHVVGFKRLLCFTAKDVRQVVDKNLSEGRLAFVSQDNVQVVVSKAQVGELELVAKVLRGVSAKGGAAPAGGLGLGLGLGRSRPLGVATPMAAARADGQPPPAKRRGAEEATRACARAGGTAAPGEPRDGAEAAQAAIASSKTSLCSLPQQVLDMVWDLEPSDSARRALAESCTQLAAYYDGKQTALRLSSRVRGVSLDPERIVNLVARHSIRTSLDLSAFNELPAGTTVRLAEVLSNGMGLHLQKLVLRGCKALSDVAIRRLLSACPRLQVLDLMEIPRLGSRALEVPLPELRILAAGSLGRPSVAERPRSGTQVDQGALTNISGVLGSTVAAPKQKLQGSMQITAVLLNRLSQRPAAPPQPPTGAGTGGAASSASSGASRGPGGAPLTHVILAGCAQIEVFPRLPQTLRHLDLRDASIQVPDAALKQWRPLAGCPHLATLCLAGNDLLSGAAILTCIGSLPPSAQLGVLDLSGTRVQAQLTTRLPQLQPALTHLRLANCNGIRNACIAVLLAGLSALEALDVAGCPGLEDPFAAVVALAAAEAQGRQAGAAQPRQPGEAPADRLRLLGVGRTEFGAHLEATRRALREMAPSAQVLGSSLDIFHGYADLPPALL